MILLTFRSGLELRLGVKAAGGVLDVAAAAGALGDTSVPTTPDALYRAGLAGEVALQRLVEAAYGRDGLWLNEDSLQYGPAVPNPGKIICVGLNYQRHAAESGMAVPTSPVLFSKFNNTIAAPGEPIPLPTVGVEHDYEVELVIVIGRRAKYVRKEEALNYVLGYCNGNDLSTRDLQLRTSQWLLGKSLDKFMPLGPYVVTQSEIRDPQNLGLRCWVNGELRQNSHTSDMIFDCAYLVHYISQHMTLEPGDIISTGTPEGVILGMKEKNWLKPGDEVTVEIDRLGRLTNRMVAE